MDVTVNKNVLKIVPTFIDDDDGTLTIDNPADSIAAGDSVAAAAIADLNNYLLGNSILIGGENKSKFIGIRTAQISTEATTEYDLS